MTLTAREKQIIGLIAEGSTNRDIGHALGLSGGTVKVFISRIYTKLKIDGKNRNGRVELLNMLQSGLLPMEKPDTIVMPSSPRYMSATMRRQQVAQMTTGYGAIHLLREGDYAVVLVEKSWGVWVEVMREHVEGNFSHIVEPLGIEEAFKTRARPSA